MGTSAKQRWASWATSALLVGCCVLVTPAAQAQKPLGAAKDLDFEGSAGKTGLPEGWGGGGLGYELAIDQTVVHSGKQSGRVSYVGKGEPDKPGFGTLTQGVSPDKFRGRRVRYSGYVRTDKAEDGGAGLWMRVDGPEGEEPLCFDNMLYRRIVGTTDWKKCEVVLDVPKEATAIYFGMLIAGKGTAWVDDLKMETVAPDTPTTDLRDRTTARNMDFEGPAGGKLSPPLWGGGGPGYEITVDKKIARGGKQSGRIRYTGEGQPTESSFGTLTQMIAADAFRGHRVRLSGHVRTDQVESGWAGLWLRVDGPQGEKPLGFDNMKTSNRAITGTTDWKQYEIVLDVPKEATQIAFGMLLAGNGTAWVDDLEIEKAGPR